MASARSRVMVKLVMDTINIKKPHNEHESYSEDYGEDCIPGTPGKTLNDVYTIKFNFHTLLTI